MSGFSVHGRLGFAAERTEAALTVALARLAIGLTAYGSVLNYGRHRYMIDHRCGCRRAAWQHEHNHHHDETSMMSKRKHATTSSLGVAALLLLAATGAWAQTQTTELTATFRKPNVDLKQYNQLLITPLNLSDTRIIPPPWVEKPNPREWDLTDENQEALRSAYASAVRKGIESGGQFKVVDAPAPGTLQVEVRLISLTPYAARGEQASTLGSGTLTFEAHVRDASTAELLAIFSGTQQVGKDYQENTAFNRAASVTEHFTSWGQNVSRRLTEARAAQ